MSGVSQARAAYAPRANLMECRNLSVIYLGDWSTLGESGYPVGVRPRLACLQKEDGDLMWVPYSLRVRDLDPLVQVDEVMRRLEEAQEGWVKRWTKR